MVVEEYGTLCAEDQTWDKETVKQLKDEYNIFYDGEGCFGFAVIPREGTNPLIQIYSEDDGFLHKTKGSLRGLSTSPPTQPISEGKRIMLLPWQPSAV